MLSRLSKLFSAVAILVTSVVVVAPESPVAAVAGYTPLAAPQRIVDTRADGVTVDGKYQATGQQAGGSVMNLEVAGRAGVDASAAAAVLNVTVVGPAGGGYLTVYPCDQATPNSSNINYQSGTTIANAVFAGLDRQGHTCLFTSQAAHVIVDVSGALPVGAVSLLAAPQRIADTRPDGDTVDDVNQATGKVGAGQQLMVKVAGRATVGAAERTAVLNVTVANPEANGHFRVFPCDQSLPNSSNLNYKQNQVVANSVVAKLDAAGNTCVFTSATAHVIVDVTGTMPASTFVPLAAPARFADTRADGETVDHDVERISYRRAGTTMQFKIGGRAGVPAGATAVVLNLTAVGASKGGYMTIHPRNSLRPNASNINFKPGNASANTVVAAIGGNGMVCLFASADIEAIVDVTGYFIGSAPVDTGKNCPQEFPANTYPVGPYQMPAGRYVSEAPTNFDCEFQRWNTDSFLGGQLGSNIMFGPGRLMGDVLPTDKFINFRFDGCAPLVPYVPPGPPFPLKTSFDSGFHVVNQHIAPGTYQATRPFGSVCTGVRYSALDGAQSSILGRFNDASASVVTMTIAPTDVGFLAGCDGWTKIG